MITADHPVVRAMALEMATEWANAMGYGPDAELIADADAFADLLCDMRRPVSRDAWVRWLEDHPYPALIGPQERMSSREMDHAAAERAHALRDNPEALTAVVCAALAAS